MSGERALAVIGKIWSSKLKNAPLPQSPTEVLSPNPGMCKNTFFGKRLFADVMKLRILR